MFLFAKVQVVDEVERKTRHGTVSSIGTDRGAGDEEMEMSQCEEALQRAPIVSADPDRQICTVENGQPVEHFFQNWRRYKHLKMDSFLL